MLLFVRISVCLLTVISRKASFRGEVSTSIMEPLVFDFSDKNIPVHRNSTFCKMFIKSVEDLDRKVSFASDAYLHPEKYAKKKETYGFRSNEKTPNVEELKPLRNDLVKLIQSLKFKPFKSDFMNKLKDSVNRIDASDKIIVDADKTSNKYLIKKSDYQSLLAKNVNSDYKIEDSKNVQKVTKEHQKIVTDLELDKRVFETEPRSAFITVKDHKEDFGNNTKCRLINPCKPDIGQISKKILENVVFVVKQKTQLKQWRNTDEVLTWFKQLNNKKRKSFIVFDICSFYPSITPDILKKALNWARKFVKITKKEENTILKSKKCFLYTGSTPWVKKGQENFDVGMGAWDGAESCEIVGLYILDHIKCRVKGFDNGLYRDDALGVVETTPRNAEKIRQSIISIMGELGFKITSKANLKVVDFLDVTLDLENDKFSPFLKPGDRPRYVNAKSNHPPAILKNIPLAVNRRLSNISSSKEVFENAAPLYQEELDRAGYSHKLEYQEELPKGKRKRNRQIIWFNPPYSRSLKTNVGKIFLSLLDKHFPKGSVLYPVINRYKVKLSYRCLPNISAMISQHNKKILNEEEEVFRCRCHDKPSCPLPGKCTTDKLVYRATITSTNAVETYVGLTANVFKDRYGVHKSNFEHRDQRGTTTLSDYIWKLKDKGEDFSVKWDVVTRAKPFSPVSKRCNLCIEEKFQILFNPDQASLNSRLELFAPCRHKSARYLVKS